MSWLSNELLPLLYDVRKKHKVDITDKTKLVEHLKKRHRSEKGAIDWASKATDKDLKDALKFVKKMHKEKQVKKIAIEILNGRS